VIAQAQAEFDNFAGTGLSILEHSHRGAAYEKVHMETLELFSELMGLPKTHAALIVQGGASGVFATLPMNFLKPGLSADYLVTGHWAKLALEEAKRVGAARPAWDGAKEKYARLPKEGEALYDAKPAFVHLTSNNTIYGTQWREWPSGRGAPLAVDMSSDILSRPVDAGRFKFIYAGAQKNLGPAGIVFIAVDRDWLACEGRTDIPDILSYRVHLEAKSLYHTPPTFAVYLAGLVLKWIKANGGAAGMEVRAKAKAASVYGAIDESGGFYSSPVAREDRSLMNIVFRLPSPELEAEFLKEADASGFVGLKGHRATGGVRASLYNAVSPEEAKTLASFMKDYAVRRG
jgi:phosphoserine aminotransferase